MRPLLVAAMIALPSLAWAVDTSTPAPPKPSPTTQSCTKGKVWDKGTKECVLPRDSRLNEEEKWQAAREFAYAGQLENAQTALRAMKNQNADHVLTYWGFTHRKLGNVDLGMAFYAKALDTNPDNLLARSYLGMAHVEAGDLRAARVQLKEIRARGGRGSWPEKALRRAITSGDGYTN